VACPCAVVISIIANYFFPLYFFLGFRPSDYHGVAVVYIIIIIIIIRKDVVHGHHAVDRRHHQCIIEYIFRTTVLTRVRVYYISVCALFSIISYVRLLQDNKITKIIYYLLNAILYYKILNSLLFKTLYVTTCCKFIMFQQIYLI